MEKKSGLFKALFWTLPVDVGLPTSVLLSMSDILMNKAELTRRLFNDPNFPTALGLVAEAGVFLTATKPGRAVLKSIISLLNNK